MSITDIGKEAAENSSSSGVSGDDYERFDLAGLKYVKNHPTTAVGGSAAVLRYIPGDPDQDNLDRGFAGLVLDDPFVYVEDDAALEGSAIFEGTKDKGDDYKVVNLTDDDTQHLEGSGIDFDGNMYYGDQVEAIDDDQVVLKLTGNAGRSATQCLDIHGAGGADVVRTEDGDPKIDPETGYPTTNNALIEYIDDEGDDYTPPRFARDTQLRPDLEGETVIFMVQRMSEVQDDYDGDSYWSTVLRETEDGDFEAVEPTDEFEPDEELLRATQWVEAYPSYEEIARLCVDQGVDVPDNVVSGLKENDNEVVEELELAA